MKTDICVLHLERFLNQHPNLSADQRAIVFEALGLLQSGIIEIDHSSAAWQVTFQADFEEIKERALAAFPLALAKEAFIDIAEPENTSATGNIQPSRPSFRLSTRVEGRLNPCDCYTGQPYWCDGLTNPTPVCKGGNCLPEHGCGWWLIETCDGVCSTQ